jgi:predicted metal-dependent phosphoesterase TrpH
MAIDQSAQSAQYADLHTHTNASDGTNEPPVNVRLAKAAGLAAVAITDHDTIAGIRTAEQEGRNIGVEVVPGVEISTVAKGQDIHVLGYYISTTDTTFLQRLERLRNTRQQRNRMLIERLHELGMDISLDEVMNSRQPNIDQETVGRPHIADVLVSKGYVATIAEAFEKYLGKSGAAYVNPPRIHPAEALEWIKAAGGTAVLAHPGLYGDDELVRELIGRGLDGLEVYHSDHSAAEEAKYLQLAESAGLLVTAGSDFHGQRHGEVFHAPIGTRKVAVDVLQLLRQRAF